VGETLALLGDLGSGKTCFVQGLAAALGAAGDVCSPTYTLVNEYRTEPPLVHMDLYRLSAAAEAYGLGLEEYFEGDFLVAVEWPDRMESLLPPAAFWIEFSLGDEPTTRRLTVPEELIS
jgi:tRNA threonylcarbamoyladenosine biosynthesis protein TsaE